MQYETINNCLICESGIISHIDATHNICKCSECGFVFDSPRPTFNDIQSFYSQEDHYDSWLENEDLRHDLWKRRLKHILKYKQSGRLLDIGTGIGQFLHHAQEHFEVHGTEVSDNAISIAQKRYTLDIFKGKIEDYTPNKKFDIITAFHVLEHVPEPDVFIQKCHSLLEKDGVLLIAVPNELQSLFRQKLKFLLKVFRVGKFKNYGIHTLPKITLDGTLFEIHLSHFTNKTLKNVLSKNDLTILEDTLDPYYAAKGPMKVIQKTLFSFCALVLQLTSRNIYDTISIYSTKK